MSPQIRLKLLLGLSILIMAVWVWSQMADGDYHRRKIEARQQRLEQATQFIARHPSLLKAQQTTGSQPNSAVGMSLSALLSQELRHHGLDRKVLSLTPSQDKNKKLSKIKCQLREVRLEDIHRFIVDLKDKAPHLIEVELDIQVQKSGRCHFSGLWAGPLR